jgi:hypothetical protein
MHPTSKILQTGPRGWQRLAVTYTSRLASRSSSSDSSAVRSQPLRRQLSAAGACSPARARAASAEPYRSAATTTTSQSGTTGPSTPRPAGPSTRLRGVDAPQPSPTRGTLSDAS